MYLIYRLKAWAIGLDRVYYCIAWSR